jgi:hypothetical protein
MIELPCECACKRVSLCAARLLSWTRGHLYSRYLVVNESQSVSVTAPKVTKELRANLVKQAKEKVEESKSSIKNIRADAVTALKKLGKDEDVHRFEKQVPGAAI